MASPDRDLSLRSASAIAADLRQARQVGGLWRTNEDDLPATLDCLALTGGVSPDEEPLARARDLLITYVKRGCERHGKSHLNDLTAQAAVGSLQVLLLRPESDSRKASVIRKASLAEVKHHVGDHAVRKREDRIIAEIAEEVFDDLLNRQAEEPQTLEAAIHRLAPMVADLRQQLHDGLCLTYMNMPPADPRERHAIEGFYRQVVIKLGDLLLTSIQLAKLGLKTANMTADEYWFVNRARNINAFLFDEADDRAFMLDFMREQRSESWEDCVDVLLASDRGRELFDRWVAWAQSCYPTCAFERSTDIGHMCSPHSFVTLLYEIEIRYLEAGYSEMSIPGNEPLLHYKLPLTISARR